MATFVFGLTSLVSAFLLFLVQPMVGRMLLPSLGGTPAVWNTCVVFFQFTLLLGYAYAHFGSKRIRGAQQVAVHFALLACVCCILPIRFQPGSTAPTVADPTIWLLGQLVCMVGLPFFVVSSSSPILQKWFSTVSRQHGQDPYFLYALSNVGSLAALVCYPFVIEPLAGLGRQTQVWMIGFVVLVLLFLMCGVLRLRCGADRALSATSPGERIDTDGKQTIPWLRKGHFILLAAVPSSLMLGVTTFITTDVGSAPLIWVFPLALYLTSFIVAFAKSSSVTHPVLVRILPFLLLMTPVLLLVDLGRWPWLVGGLHLATFFVIAAVCHGEMARLRPRVEGLTEFYFLMSIGGVVGGALNALVAPHVFSDVYEYPLMLILASLLCPTLTPRRAVLKQAVWVDVALPTGLAAVVLASWQLSSMIVGPSLVLAALLVYALPSLVCFVTSWQRPLRFALCFALIQFGCNWALRTNDLSLSERGFFGVDKIVVDRQHKFRMMINGRTIHGIQRLNGDRETPLSYYHRQGPIGDIFECARKNRFERFAVIGLGAGTIAAYGRPHQHFDFYEIDPIVTQLAQDARFFTFLGNCAADWRIVSGDARVQLRSRAVSEVVQPVSLRPQTPASDLYQLIVLDAFSSDSIPSHLITREAFELYLSLLDPDGAIAVHITNKHLDLRPLLATAAVDLNLQGLIRDDRVAGKLDDNGGRLSSVYVVLTRSSVFADRLRTQDGWQDLHGDGTFRMWTDDYVNILEVLSW